MRIPQLTLCALFATLLSSPTLADHRGGNNECPVESVNTLGLSLNQEFGPGTQELTRCIKKRHNVKMVVQINQYCTNQANCANTPYALNNISNILDDYEITHGMTAGRDYELVAVLHSPGGQMALKNTSLNGALVEVTGRNLFEGKIKALMDRGVKFYFCQNTTRAYIAQNPATSPLTSLPNYNTTGVSATDQLIEGMQYTTAGLTSIADFEALGYAYIQP